MGNYSLELNESLAYFSSQALKILICLAGTLLNFLLCVIITRTKTMHLNTRILLFGLSASCGLRTLQQFCKDVYAIGERRCSGH